MNIGFVYHICIKTDFNTNNKNEQYYTNDLEQTGFIHCCTKQQMPGVLERFFKVEQDLVALKLNPTKVKAKLIYEVADQGLELFPHIYGMINHSAIEEVITITQADFSK